MRAFRFLGFQVSTELLGLKQLASGLSAVTKDKLSHGVLLLLLQSFHQLLVFQMML